MSEQKSPGYDHTPLLPGGQWQVHDYRRPQPRLVTPGSETGAAPSDAIFLFDGSSISGWAGSEGDAKWSVKDKHMEVVPGKGDIWTKDRFGDCQLHLEFACPATIKGESQGRGNSGVFMMSIYEIQVLDGFKNPTYADGITASIYGQFPPLVNACRKPGDWQTYDIIWTAPRFSGVALVKPAYLTLLHNGVLVHNHAELMGPTVHCDVCAYKAHAPTGPLKLQDHGDLVRYRNIWYRPIKGYDEQ